MLKNLDKARREKDVSIVDMADLLNVRSQTVADKIQGRFDFKFKEALMIQRAFFPEYDLVNLFIPEETKEEQHA